MAQECTDNDECVCRRPYERDAASGECAHPCARCLAVRSYDKCEGPRYNCVCESGKRDNVTDACLPNEAAAMLVREARADAPAGADTRWLLFGVLSGFGALLLLISCCTGLVCTVILARQTRQAKLYNKTIMARSDL